MVIIQKFRLVVLVSNVIEYWSNYSIRFKISNIRTALIYTAYTDKTNADDLSSDVFAILVSAT